MKIKWLLIFVIIFSFGCAGISKKKDFDILKQAEKASANVTISGVGNDNTSPASTTYLEGETSGAVSEHFTIANLLKNETDPVVKAISGIVKSDGSTISAASAGTDYLSPSGSGASLTGIPLDSDFSSNGILERTAAGIYGIATAGTDYQAPLTAGSDYLRPTTDVDATPVNSELAQPISSDWAYDHVAAADPHTGYALEGSYLALADIDNVPVEDETAAPISSGYMYTHINAADPHTVYLLEHQVFTAFTGSDVTPDVSGGEYFQTADTTTITDFDDGSDSSTLVDGQLVVVLCLHAGTFDFTASGLTSPYGENHLMIVGSVEIFYYDLQNATWVWATPKAPTSTITEVGIIARVASGIAGAVTITGTANEITVTNGDGESGGAEADPTISLPATVDLSGKTVVVADEAYDATNWDSDTAPPQKDDVRDKIETMPTLAGTNTFTGANTIGDGGDDTSLVMYKNATNEHWSGITIVLTAHETLAFGNLVYIFSDGEAALADSDAAATMPCIGIVVVGAAADSPATILTHGVITDTDWNFTTVGARLYVGETAGAIEATLSNISDTNDVVQIIGVALHADTILFNSSLVEAVLE